MIAPENTVKDKTLYESAVSLTTDMNNYEKGKPKNWEKVRVTHDAILVNTPYYGEPHLDAVLETYRERLTETHFLFPIATLKALEHLKSLCYGNMLVLSSDKAHSTLEEQDELEYPELAFHGSFSVMANFDAIARVFKLAGGDALLQTPREGITTAAFASGFKFSDFPETSLALEEYIEGFSPGDYFLLHDQVCLEDKNVKLEVYTALLCMSRWDSYVYNLMSESISKLIHDADSDTLEYLAKNMHKVAKNFYFISGVEDTLFNVGLFFHEAEKYKEALPYYLDSIRIFGEQHSTVFNLAICHYGLGNLRKALSLFQRSLEIDPKQKDVKDWIKTVERKIKQ